MSDLLTPEKKAAPIAEVIVDIVAVPTVAVMDLLAGAEPRAESPLHRADLKTIAHRGPKQGGVCLQELKLLGHLVLRGQRDDSDFMSAAENVLGVALPGPLQSAERGELSVRWISPDEWLVVVPGEQAFALESQLHARMTGHYAVVNVSGAQTILSLSGQDARKVLQKSTPYDVHERNFPVGKAVTSVFAKTQAVIRRTGEESWELVIRRSFADYAWLWLQGACAEYGLVVKD
ncbi:MAG: sarcosine oxidase subunit gamma family protein [Motiliproteus sp.]